MLQLCTKGIKVTVVCPGPIETPQSSAAASQVQMHSAEVIPGFSYLVLACLDPMNCNQCLESASHFIIRLLSNS